MEWNGFCILFTTKVEKKFEPHTTLTNEHFSQMIYTLTLKSLGFKYKNTC